MGYSNFKKIQTLTKKFGLDAKWGRLFEKIEPIEASAWLQESLVMSRLMPLMNEKTKAERIVSPILLEVIKPYADKLTFFSGESLDIDNNQDLAGECDFFFSLHPPKPYIEAPIISIAEAKDEDMEWGLAQCAAQLYGAKLFNEAEGKNIPFLYGCATDGVEWQFMKFEANQFYIHNEITTALPQILGTWHYIIQLYLD
jgi:hypothetical protein